ncbi:MAG: alpha/beta hydrolase [Clostridia bacterium]|nr:alpha/beta hydrolase [Clostridia bacterium]
MLIIILSIMAYYWIVDIQTQVPQELKQICDLKTEKFMGRNIFIVTPKNKEKTDKRILYFHGGSYVAEATKQHWDFIEKIVNDTGATVILPDYPLTPKYNYKDVFKMVTPLYQEIIERVDPSNLIIMGDSAGGGLALALEEKVGKQNLPMPAKTILISPWLDVRLTNPQIDEVQKNDKQLNKETLKLAGIAYSGGREEDNNTEEGINSYLVNPIEGDLSKLKNVVILTGTYDILNPDVHRLKQKAEEVGVTIEIKEYEQATHIWIIEKNSTQELEEQGYQEILKQLQ